MDYPSVSKKINIGACMLTPFWAYKYNMYGILVLSLIPGIGQIVSIVAFFRGSKWMWDKVKWTNTLRYNMSINEWNKWGMIIIVFWILAFWARV